MLNGKINRGIALAFIGVAALGLSGCKKKPPVTDPTTEGPSVVELTLRNINPNSSKNDVPTDVVINGAAFAPGAKVFIGDTPAQNVVVKSESQITATVPAGLAPNTYLVVVRNPDGKEASLLRGFSVFAAQVADQGACEVATIYFGFDDATLDESARADLGGGFNCLRQKQAKKIRLEGHADERGSTDYNLALGQRRADSVKSFLINLGFPASTVSSMSYGEEKPADEGRDEGAWSRNRRVEIVVVE